MKHVKLHLRGESEAFELFLWQAEQKSVDSLAINGDMVGIPDIELGHVLRDVAVRVVQMHYKLRQYMLTKESKDIRETYVVEDDQ